MSNATLETMCVPFQGYAVGLKDVSDLGCVCISIWIRNVPVVMISRILNIG